MRSEIGEVGFSPTWVGNHVGSLEVRESSSESSAALKTGVAPKVSSSKRVVHMLE